MSLTSHLARYFLLYVIAIVGAVLGVYYYFNDGQVKNLDELYKEAFCKDCAAELEDYGAAPEFVGITNWLNAEPLTMAELRGKVVLVDFWTYSCINCIRTMPYVTQWYEKYKDQGFVIVGVHTPEFAFEKETKNVERAIKQYGITYPVAQDNNFETWRAYNNRYWPAHYLINKEGHIVYTHFGEGNYDITENTIRSLLGQETMVIENEADSSQSRTPEIYFGLSRLDYLSEDQTAVEIPFDYSFPHTLSQNRFAVEGKWRFDREYAEAQSAGAIRLRFNARTVHMVAEADVPLEAEILVDGREAGTVTIGQSDLYTLYDSDRAESRLIEIRFGEGGLKAFTFTFG